jgi:hypothetical protein
MARPIPSWKALQGGILGEVVLPDSPSYEELPKPFNARFHDIRPHAIVRCATLQDVAETISFAGGTAWSARCGAEAIASPGAR